MTPLCSPPTTPVRRVGPTPVMSSQEPPTPDSTTVNLTHDRRQIDRIERDLLDAIARHGYGKASQFAIRLAFEEAVSNAFHHGHRGLSPDLPVTVQFSVAPSEVRISVEDRGPGFQPGAVPDPTLDENIENPSGRGLMLMRAYMTSVAYSPSGNRVTMIYQRPAKP